MTEHCSGVPVWLVLMTSLFFLQGAVSQYFCQQFHSRRSPSNGFIAPPMVIRVNDSVKAGEIIKSFSKVSKHNGSRAFFDSGDINAVYYESETQSLKATQDLRKFAGQLVSIQGECNQAIPELTSVLIPVPIRLDVVVVDINDPPVFLNLPFTAYHAQNALRGTKVHQVLAKDYDIDIGDTQKIKYSILNITNGAGLSQLSLRTDVFHIDQNGLVYLRANPHFSENEYLIRIQAEDSGVPPMFNTSVLRVVINPVEALFPEGSEVVQGESCTFNIDVSERELVKDTCLGSCVPLVGDKVFYNIARETDGEPGTDNNGDSNSEILGAFYIDLVGNICLKRALDNERLLQNFSVVLEARNEVSGDHRSSEIHFTFTLRNKNKPVFERPKQVVYIPEYPDTRRSQELCRVVATDKDFGRNGKVIYQLVNHREKIFRINRNTGAISAALPQKLDFEGSTKTFTLEVTAVESESKERYRSRGNANVTFILTDVNDHYPEPEKDRVSHTVFDTHLKGQPISPEPIRATDRDQGPNAYLTYEISSIWTEDGMPLTREDMGRFSINQNGLIILENDLADLRRSQRYPTYLLRVKIADNPTRGQSLKSDMTVEITIVEGNRFKPEFQGGKIPSTFVPESSTASEPEHIPDVSKLFDAEISENAHIGSVVEDVSATDKDGDSDVFLRYSIVNGSGKGMFRIDQNGRVLLARKLNREDKSDYKLLVKVTDGKFEAFAHLAVNIKDVNDNSPRFERANYRFLVPEDVSSLQNIGDVVAKDGDDGRNGEVIYSLLDQGDANFFRILPNGTLRLRLGRQLDYERKSTYVVVVQARDNGRPAMKATQVVFVVASNVNDNSPVLSQFAYEGEIEESAIGASRLVKMTKPISATDADGRGATIKYTLEGADSNHFAIDPITGVLTAKRRSKLDAERKTAYVFKVVATDESGQGRQSKAAVTVNIKDINDNKPSFGGPYTFRVKDQVKSAIGAITAVDRDLSEKFRAVLYILKEGGYGKFRVDTETGEVFLTNAFLTSPPYLPQYTLVIEALNAQDRTLVDTIRVTVDVDMPKFHGADLQSEARVTTPKTMRVQENKQAGSRVGVVGMPGNGIFYRMRDGNVPFTVNNVTGVVTTTADIDREATEKFEFAVISEQRTEMGFFQESFQTSSNSIIPVTVWVEDVNDNHPRFDRRTYEGEVEENDGPSLGRNRVVVMNFPLLITDSDLDQPNRETRIFLESNSGVHEYFDVDPESYAVTVSREGRRKIDAESSNVFKLRVVALNTAEGRLSDKADLEIKVKDMNDNAPRVSENALSFEANVRMSAGAEIGKIVGTDGDRTSPNNKIIYLLKDGGSGRFVVDHVTGAVLLDKLFLSPPIKNLYTFEVLLLDSGHPSMQSTVTVQVNVDTEGADFFPPEIITSSVISVYEETPTGETIGRVTAEDKDGSSLTFKANGNSQSSLFVVMPDGRIKVNRRLDYEQMSPKYVVLPVTVTDQSGKSAESNVLIVVEDINDRPPKFGRTSYSHSVSNLFNPGVIVATPQAHEPDDTIKSSYSYSMEPHGPGDADGSWYFKMDAQTGVIKVTPLITTIPERTFQFILKASDRKMPELYDRVNLTIHAVNPTKKEDRFEECECSPCENVPDRHKTNGIPSPASSASVDSAEKRGFLRRIIFSTSSRIKQK